MGGENVSKSDYVILVHSLTKWPCQGPNHSTSALATEFQLGTIQKLRHPVVAPTGVGKNDGSMMHRGG